jgi:hypothetical protein
MGKATFDLVAGFYPLLEQMVFGSTLSRARRFFIPRVREGNKILLIGEGSGRFLFEMVKQTSSDACFCRSSNRDCRLLFANRG